MNTKILKLLFLILFIGLLNIEEGYADCAAPQHTLSLKHEGAYIIRIKIQDRETTNWGSHSYYKDYCFNTGESLLITIVGSGSELYPNQSQDMKPKILPDHSLKITCWGNLVSDAGCKEE